MERPELIALLQEMLLTHSPSGREEEMDRFLLPRLRELADEVRQDDMGNLIAVRRGASEERPLGVVTHKDELGMLVKRIEVDGRVRLDATWSTHPWIYGEGPMDLLGEEEIVPAVLSFGSRHVSDESHGSHPGLDQHVPRWSNSWLSTGLTRDELEAKGVRIGTKAVVGRGRKTPLLLGDNICGYGLDCKGGVAVILGVMAALRQRRLARTVHFLITAKEEPAPGVLGGLYAARMLRLHHLVAVEVGPVADEYQTVNCERPILLYKDTGGLYDDAGNRALAAAAGQVGVEVQRAVVTSFGSDASWPARSGFVPRANCICFPTENTHGYEIASLSGIENTLRVLTRFVLNECGGE